MSNLALSIPPAAQKLLDAMPRSAACPFGLAACTEETIWTRNPNGTPARHLFGGSIERKDALTYLHPSGKIMFQGLVTPGDTRPDGSKWTGEKPMYLIVYHHPKSKLGMCDAHWFELDVVDVEIIIESEQLPE